MENENFYPVEFSESNYEWSEVISDVSGNGTSNESDQEESEVSEFNETKESDESETVTYDIIDYTNYFENIQNNQLVSNALLIALILLIGVGMGLKK